MQKDFIIIIILAFIVLVTLIFGRWIGPKLIDWFSPYFNKITNKIDDAIVGKPGSWEVRIQEIVEAKPEQLKQQVADVLARFAKPRSPNSPLLSSMGMPLTKCVADFFSKYEYLSFDGYSRILDVAVLRMVIHKNNQYLLIGVSEDNGQFYAIDMKDKNSIVCLEMINDDKIYDIEEDCSSFNHFILLNYELHLKNIGGPGLYSGK